MPAAAKPLTLAMARLLAEVHANLGLAQFNELQRVRYEEKQHGRKSDFTEHVRYAVPAVTSLSLALELALKVVYFQHFGTYPHTHDLVTITAALPLQARTGMGETYRQLYARPQPSEVVHFRLEAASDDGSFSQHSLPDVAVFDSALAHVAGAFVTWRYVHERLEVPQPVDVHFKALLCLVEAAMLQIAQFKGEWQVTLGPRDAVV